MLLSAPLLPAQIIIIVILYLLGKPANKNNAPKTNKAISNLGKNKSFVSIPYR
jgi:hypothetical protein